MIVEYERWQLRPYSNGLCWELFEYREIKPREGEPYNDWVSLGKYPSTLGHGLAIILELALKQGLDVADVKSAADKVERIAGKLMEVR